MKKFFLLSPIFLVVAFMLLSVLFNVAVAAKGYMPLEPLPGMEKNVEIKPTAYLSALYTFGITLAGMLAVIMIIIGAVQYMTAAGRTGSVEGGKEKIWNAIWGLLLVFASYMVLEIINPDLVNWSNSFFK